MLRRMLREHHITDDLLSSEGSCVLPLCCIDLISENGLCSSSSGYRAVISTLTVPCLSVISAVSMLSRTKLGL